LLASSSKATATLSSTRTVRIVAPRANTASPTEFPLRTSIPSHGASSSLAVREDCLIVAHLVLLLHQVPTVLLHQALTALLPIMIATIITMTRITSMARSTTTTPTKTTTTTTTTITAKVLPALALTARADVTVDAAAAAEGVEVAMALGDVEDEAALVLTTADPATTDPTVTDPTATTMAALGDAAHGELEDADTPGLIEEPNLKPPATPPPS